MAGVTLLSASALANPTTTIPLKTRVSNAVDLTRGALQAMQGDATFTLDFNEQTGLCGRANATFKIANPSHPQKEVQQAWFSFSPSITRFEHMLTSGGNARSVLLPLPNTGNSSISLRFNSSISFGKTATEVALGEFNGFQTLGLHNSSKQLVSLCSETSKNIQDIRTFMASVGYVASQVQGREGASGDPARCSLSVTAQPLPSCATCARPPAIQRRVGLGGTCSSPKIFSRIPNADLARAIGGTPGQPLPHLSCRTPPSSGTTPAQVDEIPLRMLSSAQQEELRKDLEFYATNQTTCSGM